MTIRNLPQVDIAARPAVRSDVSQSALMRWSPDVRASSEDDATISILDVIGHDFWDEGVTAKRISAALRRIGERPVTVVINSPGGDMFEGLAIYNILREHKAQITVKIVGIAASAASVIAMAGDEIQISRAGFLMIHNAWVVAGGNRHDMREVADWLEPFDEAMAGVYAARSGLDEAAIAAMMDAETYLNGQQAIDKGLADALLSRDEVTVSPDDAQALGLRAERRMDILARRAGVSREDARALMADLKSGGKRGAAPTGEPGAAELAAQLTELRGMFQPQ